MDDLLTRTEAHANREWPATTTGLNARLIDANGLLNECLVALKTARREAQGRRPWEESSLGGPQSFRRAD